MTKLNHLAKQMFIYRIALKIARYTYKPKIKISNATYLV